MYRKLVPTVFAFLFIASCSKQADEVDNYDPARDYFTFANTDQFVTEHLALDLDGDMEAEELRGSAMKTERRLDAAATEMDLDTRDLTISSAAIVTAESSARAEFRLGDTDETLGTPLHIAVPADAGEQFDLVLAGDHQDVGKIEPCRFDVEHYFVISGNGIVPLADYQVLGWSIFFTNECTHRAGVYTDHLFLFTLY